MRIAFVARANKTLLLPVSAGSGHAFLPEAGAGLWHADGACQPPGLGVPKHHLRPVHVIKGGEGRVQPVGGLGNDSAPLPGALACGKKSAITSEIVVKSSASSSSITSTGKPVRVAARTMP